MKTIKIVGAYNWATETNKGKEKNDYSRVMILALINQVKLRLKDHINSNLVKIFYTKLRATAGSFVFFNIRDRILKSNFIIFDITELNPNVMFELGVALAFKQDKNEGAKVLIVCQGKTFDISKIPCDLHGYFISFYTIVNKKVTFHDNNSIVMRIVSDIIEGLDINYTEDEYK